MICAAVDGLGLTFSFEDYIASQIASGALVRVLEDWCSPFPGYFSTTRVGGSNPQHCQR